MASYPLINGLKYDYSSIEIDIGDIGIFTGVKEISFTHSLEPGEVRGTRAELIGRTRGEYSAEGSMVVYSEEYAEIIKALGDGFMEKAFSITITYSDTNVPVQVNRLIGCRITNMEGGGSQGTDPLEVSLDLSIFRVETGGLNAVSGILT
jgi:hypothetical protein